MKLHLIIATYFIIGTVGAERSKITDKELQAFTEELLKKDVNNAAQHIQINYQGHTKSSSTSDEAPQPLIVIRSQALQIPTISKLRLLYDNYIRDAGINEYVTPAERAEENSLLEAFMATPVMKHTMNFLSNKGLVSRDPKVQKDLLKQIWFTMYSRGGGKIGSSAFEHVFLGELKRGEISGMHNWVFFATEEAQRQADYLGYIRKLDLGGKGAILKLHYKWSNVLKPVGSMFVGTSPELEMALYTVCFLVHPDEKCQVRMAGKNFSIRTHTYRYRGKNTIGSAFPEI
ncbi:endoribonuclease CG2145-like isoform X2 [Periplaneta americana]|uniref:endoribonuclease CG2145-like isoform X2 n=1 Tax=Periplaneta americana TaxID=6978 RepID=UPI0037E9A647